MALTGGSFPVNWSFVDYLLHYLERSGILGIYDFGVQAVQHGPAGLAGPAAEHLEMILKWLNGSVETDRLLARTIPGARFIL
jgi:hypothetical protein